MILDVGPAPSVLWSSHTDTVHRKGGSQRIRYDRKTATVSLDPSSGSDCLGADCAAGVWLMLELIRANVPGRYVFHRAEEIGGHGSSYIAKQTPELLDGIRAAIAFDRRGTDEIITDQCVGKCASTDFAWSLAKQLGPRFRPSSWGSFTDVANYAGQVPECVNVAVGYDNEHSARETLDVAHLLTVRAALLDLDPAALVISREPGDMTWDVPARSSSGALDYVQARDGETWTDRDRWDRWLDRADNADSLRDLIRRNPDAIAHLLESYGFDAREVRNAIEEYQGSVNV